MGQSAVPLTACPPLSHQDQNKRVE